jgi:hypothetical protein
MSHKDHKTRERRSFAWTDYRDLLIAAHQQLGAPIERPGPPACSGWETAQAVKGAFSVAKR